MNATLELELLGMLGVLIHYIKQWVATQNMGKQYNLKKFIPTIVLSSITTAVLIYLREDIENLYPITRFSAVVLGYFGNSVFFSFMDARKPKTLPEPEVTE